MVSQRDGAGAVRPAGPSGPRAMAPATMPIAYASPHPGATSERTLSRTQVAAIRAAIRLFVADDIARGVAPSQRAYCDSCQRTRQAAGSVQYGRYPTCNICAAEYEVARARGLISSIGQFVRDKHFGDGDAYTLTD